MHSVLELQKLSLNGLFGGHQNRRSWTSVDVDPHWIDLFLRAP